MAENTKIEWADLTLNIIPGCSKISEGCRNCYAERSAAMCANYGNADYQQVVRTDENAQHYIQKWNGRTVFIEKNLHKPLSIKKPKKIFINSMGDVFHPENSFEQIDKIMSMIALCRRHTFQILTKRIDRAFEYFMVHLMDPADQLADAAFSWTKNDDLSCQVANSINGWLNDEYNVSWPMKNLWLGTSVENQRTADIRRKHLQKLSKAGFMTWVSSEPRIGRISWENWEFIDWLVTGGETGDSNTEPLNPRWVLDDVEWTKSYNIPFFFKQWGEWVPTGGFVAGVDSVPGLPKMKYKDSNFYCQRVGRKKSGSMIDGKHYKEFPKV